MKKTLVVGASLKEDRASNTAVHLLRKYGHEVIAYGREEGSIRDVSIESNFPQQIEGLDTVTMYLGAPAQKNFYEQILALKPQRIIFNPGTENLEFEKLAQEQGIKTEEACTLVLLSTGQY